MAACTLSGFKDSLLFAKEAALGCQSPLHGVCILSLTCMAFLVYWVLADTAISMYQRQAIMAFKPFFPARNIFTVDVKNQLTYS